MRGKLLQVILTAVLLLLIMGALPTVAVADTRNGMPENYTIYYFGTGQADHGQTFTDTTLNNMDSPGGGNPEEIVSEVTQRYDLPQRGPKIWNNNAPKVTGTDASKAIFPYHPDTIQHPNYRNRYANAAGESRYTGGGPGFNYGGVADAKHSHWNVYPSVRLHKTTKGGEHIRKNETINAIDEGWSVERPLYVNSTGNVTVESTYRAVQPYGYTDCRGDSKCPCVQYQFQNLVSGVSRSSLRVHDTQSYEVTNESLHERGTLINEKTPSFFGSWVGNRLPKDKMQYSGLGTSASKLSTSISYRASYQERSRSEYAEYDSDGNFLGCKWGSWSDWQWLGTCDSLGEGDECYFETTSVEGTDITVEHLQDTDITTFQHPDGTTSSVIQAPHAFAGYRIGNVTVAGEGGGIVDDIVDSIPFFGGGSSSSGSSSGGNVGDVNETDISRVEGKPNMIETTWSVFYTRDRRYDTYYVKDTTGAGGDTLAYDKKTVNGTDPPLLQHAYPEGTAPEPNRQGPGVSEPRRVAPNKKPDTVISGIDYVNRPPPRIERDESNVTNVSKFIYTPDEDVLAGQSEYSPGTYGAIGGLTAEEGNQLVAENLLTPGEASPHSSIPVSKSDDPSRWLNTTGRVKQHLRSVDPVYESESISFRGSKGRGVNADVPMQPVYRDHTQMHINHRKNVNNTDVRIYSLANPTEPAYVINANETTKELVWKTNITTEDVRFNSSGKNTFNLTMEWTHPKNPRPPAADYDFPGEGKLFIEDPTGNKSVTGESAAYKSYSVPKESKKTQFNTSADGYVHIYYKPDSWLASSVGSPARKGTEQQVKITPLSNPAPAILISMMNWIIDIVIRVLPFLLVIYMARAVREKFYYSNQN